MTNDNEFTSVRLGDLFNKEEIKIFGKLLKKGEWNELKVFLNSEPTKTNLYNKGVIADYLYYMLQNNFNVRKK